VIKKHSISIVIPAFNEAKRIIPTIYKISNYIAPRFDTFEIIVVDDGSIDDTSFVVSSIIKKLKNVCLIKIDVNKGKGFAVKTGVLSSNNNLVLYCDADMSTPIEETEKLFPWIEQGYPIVIGSRRMKDSHIKIRQPWYREHIGRIFNLFVIIFTVRGIRDTQCGFKLFRGDLAREIFQKSKLNGFSFDVEILLLAKKSGLTIKEVPVEWANSPDSKVRIFNDSLQMLIDLFKIMFYWIFGFYKK
jgi:dolichyl-phosphate beta-glucosyltransferase